MAYLTAGERNSKISFEFFHTPVLCSKPVQVLLSLLKAFLLPPLLLSFTLMV